MSDIDFAEKLLFEEQVAVVPGSSFGAAGNGYVRCAYCTAYDKLEEALTQARKLVKVGDPNIKVTTLDVDILALNLKLLKSKDPRW